MANPDSYLEGTLAAFFPYDPSTNAIAVRVASCASADGADSRAEQ